MLYSEDTSKNQAKLLDELDRQQLALNCSRRDEVAMSFFTSRRQNEPDAPVRIEKAEIPALTVPTQPVGFETVLGANCLLEGKLKSNSNVRLDGAFTGTLEITGNVLVGESAKINADINAKNISIAGAVRGNVSGKKVQILRTGRVWGDISATALTTEEGAFIDGKISMFNHEANNPQPSVPSEKVIPLDVEPTKPSVETDAEQSLEDETEVQKPESE
jgi:cytoskeletal protein CcmA (bactofilin family)